MAWNIPLEIQQQNEANSGCNRGRRGVLLEKLSNVMMLEVLALASVRCEVREMYFWRSLMTFLHV